MTEKRYSFNWERGHPQFWDNHCDLADCYLTCEDVVKLLNELREENQDLKEQVGNDYNEANSMTVKIAGLTEELDYFKSKCASLEEGLFQADRENTMLKHTIDRNEVYIDKLTHKGEWRTNSDESD